MLGTQVEVLGQQLEGLRICCRFTSKLLELVGDQEVPALRTCRSGRNTIRNLQSWQCRSNGGGNPLSHKILL